MPADDHTFGATEYFNKVAKPYRSYPPEHGARDNSLLALARRINLSSPKVLLDLGCGQGRLLAALKVTHSQEELSNLHYVGVDQGSLEACRQFFADEIAPTGATACFMDRRLFAPFFLADYVVLVFVLHELDPTCLDKTIALYWRVVRNGGRLLIQDSEAAIHDEIEYLPFSPELIENLLKPLDAEVSYEVTIAGRRQIPVFVLEAIKAIGDIPAKGFITHDLSKAYRSVLHRSILRDCNKFMEYRTLAEAGSTINTADLAMLCHCLAIKSRGFHQTYAYDEMESTLEPYCLACGTLQVETQREDPNFKDPGIINVTCRACGFSHEKWFDWSDDMIADRRTTHLLIFLDRGLPELRDKHWYLEEFFREAIGRQTVNYVGPGLTEIWIPMLLRTPGVTKQEVKAFADKTTR